MREPDFGWDYPAGCNGPPEDEPCDEMDHCYECNKPLPDVADSDCIEEFGYCSIKCVLERVRKLEEASYDASCLMVYVAQSDYMIDDGMLQTGLDLVAGAKKLNRARWGYTDV